MRDQLHPTLPLPEGDRLVEVEVRDAASSASELRVLHDFLNWRQDARTIEEWGAYRTLERNLILGDARPEPVQVAEITASAFRVARVPPLLGRPLLDADERPGAPSVVVLGYGVWQQQFGGRPDAIGRTLQLGRAQLTVVGVMPEGFAFPENHKLWIPLQLPSSGYAPLEGPAVLVFGRLAPGTPPSQATAEIAALTSRVAATSPNTHQHLRPRVFPYGAEDLDGGSWVSFAITGGLPFWMRPGLKFGTVIYAALLAVVAAGILGVLPAIKATGSGAPQLTASGLGGATLRFGKVWTTAMIAQVALTLICIVPAKGISEEALRDRAIRSRFPAAQYLAVEIAVDRAVPTRDGEASPSADRVEQLYGELERRITQEPGVLAIAFGDRLPGMEVSVRRAQVEVSPGTDPIPVPNLWIAAVGPGYFEMFDRPILSGRDFHRRDSAPGARSVLVNEAFARRYTGGGSPVGRRVRYPESDPAKPGPWLEIVGMVRDIGMTPTDLGEAPYVFHAASPATVSPLVMGVRLAGDPSALALRVRKIAAAVDPDMRLRTVQPLDDVVWSHDARQLAVSGGIAGIVSLGTFLSAAGIFSLMSVSVARRTREIGLRVALGAGRGRVLAGILSQALVLIGSGIAAGSAVLMLLVTLADADDVGLGFMVRELLITSPVIVTVGLLGCVAPARRALRINPTEALKEA